MNNNTLDKLVQYSKNYGFIYQGSEIYGGLANTWDYGPLGSLLKENIKKAWRYFFVQTEVNNVLIDSSILLNPEVWQASGHLEGFNDPLIENKDSNQRYRADKLIKDFDNNINPDGWTHEQMFEYIIKNKIVCPVSKTNNWLPIRSFNMMFQTYQGVIADSANKVYLRPETAQGIFINFKNIARTSRLKVPFGISQIGKSFRNEITPGNFIFRTREFEQMELEFFCKPGTEQEWFDYWLTKMKNFLTNLGIKEKNIQLHNHSKEELSHYSNFTTDILYRFPWGFDELWGIASRTDFDLKSHENHSGKDLTYLDPETNERYHPYVVEPSVGVERLLLSFLNDSLVEEELPNGDSRTLLKIHPALAPYKVAVLPLIRKRHNELSEDIFKQLSKHFDTTFDTTQNIGRRYRRQDAIGTPLCITIDDNSISDNTVTVRFRDTMEQETIKITDLVDFIKKHTMIE